LPVDPELAPVVVVPFEEVVEVPLVEVALVVDEVGAEVTVLPVPTDA